jgi:hypothetical protein
MIPGRPVTKLSLENLPLSAKGASFARFPAAASCPIPAAATGKPATPSAKMEFVRAVSGWPPLSDGLDGKELGTAGGSIAFPHGILAGTILPRRPRPAYCCRGSNAVDLLIPSLRKIRG